MAAKDEVCITVDSETKMFLERLICGKSMSFEPKKLLEEYDLFEPIQYKMCGLGIDMYAALKNIEYEINVKEPRFKSLKSTRNKLIRILKSASID